MGVWDLRPKMEDEDGVPDVLLEDVRVNEDRDVDDLEKRNEPNNAPSATENNKQANKLISMLTL